MMRTIFIFLSLGILAACAEQADAKKQPAASAIRQPKPMCEIDDNSMAGIPLGTTLNQVREQFPHAIITPVSDGDGTTFTSIKLNSSVEVFAYTEEGDKADSPISYLETQSRSCKTAEGIHPEMRVNDVVKQYGDVEQIMLSEIEARQTIEFAAQPPELSFRIDDTGIFDENDKTYPQISTAYQENAQVVSISVMDLPAEETSSEPQNASR